MENLEYIQGYLRESIETKRRLLEDNKTLQQISSLSNRLITAFDRGNKVMLAGNGGSAADSQHIAAEFVSRFFFDRPGLPSIALTTDTSMLTAIGNDYGFEQVFSRQLQALGQEGDVFIGITTSGNSKNIIEAFNYAKSNSIETVVFCGEGGAARELADCVISVPSASTPFIQESHICIGHIICAIVEQKMFGK